MIVFGSSPRVRGKQIACERIIGTPRIIPARAGQTHWPAIRTIGRTDHPRACGANGIECAHRTCRHGSSPRGRGKRRRLQRRRGPGRIIPARAGQTSARDMSRNAYADHPRACGANATTAINVSGAAGSSPRVRGKPLRKAGLVTNGRIIPARAGQTPRPRCRNMRATDHPRACGANGSSVRDSARRHGSSPRVRGKRVSCGICAGVLRIIPARAGQTRTGRCGSRTIPDHPRACGANVCGSWVRFATFGSSPRVRGKRAGPHDVAGQVRIIPARAGQTDSPWKTLRAESDHPRACGANLASASPVITVTGSSPRVRGKPPMT